jgi:hypothetical protein
MRIEDAILIDPSELCRIGTSPSPRPCAAPTELERIQRKPVCYNHAAPLELQTAGRHADERSCCLCPNPQEWQIIAGGRNGVETSGCVVLFDPRILKGCQSSATPPGSAGDFGLRSGGIALLNPRLLSGKPPACSPTDPKTNKAARWEAVGRCGLHFNAAGHAPFVRALGRGMEDIFATDFTDNSDAFYPCHL